MTTSIRPSKYRVVELNISVHVDAVDGTQMAAKITGTFQLDGARYPFTAIAFGRIGGQNIGATLDDGVQAKLRSAGHDPEDVAMEIQRRLLRGEMSIPENLKKESFLDD